MSDDALLFNEIAKFDTFFTFKKITLCSFHFYKIRYTQSALRNS